VCSLNPQSREAPRGKVCLESFSLLLGGPLYGKKWDPGGGMYLDPLPSLRLLDLPVYPCFSPVFLDGDIGGPPPRLSPFFWSRPPFFPHTFDPNEVFFRRDSHRFPHPTHNALQLFFLNAPSAGPCYLFGPHSPLALLPTLVSH